MSIVINSQSAAGGLQLKRSYKMKDLILFGLVFMNPLAGVMLFGLSTQISQGHMILTYLIAFGAMLFTAYSYGKMVEAFPVAGSTYSYAKRIHPSLGFLSGWVMILDYVFIPVICYLIAASYSNAMIPDVPIWAWICLYLCIVTFINLIGNEMAIKANIMLTIVMVIAIAAFIAAAVVYMTRSGSIGLVHVNAFYNPNTFSTDALISGTAIAVVGYLGFDAITTMAEEADVKVSRIGSAIMLACAIQTVFSVTIAYFGTAIMPDFSQISNPDNAFFDIAMTVGGSALQIFITLVVIIASIACSISSLSAASRLLYGMGRENVIPAKLFGYLHSKYKVPTVNILLLSVVGLVCSLFLSLSLVTDLVSFGGLIGFTTVNLAVIKHYYMDKKEKHTIKYLLIPGVGIAVCLYILNGLSIYGKVVGICWVGIGIMYLIIRASASKPFRLLLTKRLSD
jgi:putrescine importer